jgi:hypothetical protein
MDVWFALAFAVNNLRFFSVINIPRSSVAASSVLPIHDKSYIGTLAGPSVTEGDYGFFGVMHSIILE